MYKLKFIIPLSFLVMILFSYKPITPVYAEVVEGTIISGKHNKPVGNAHVYIVDGEEEALTNAKGEFKIETIQKFPLVLTVEQPDHEKEKADYLNSFQEDSR